jgi:hypothetical protein
MEMVKILKEDQERLSRRVDSIECTSIKKINTATNASSNVFHLTDWKTVSQHKRQTKTESVPNQQFEIPTVINHYTILENLNEDNLTSHHYKINKKSKVRKPKIKSRSATNKVLIIADSHAKCCAAYLLHECGEPFEVMGKVMPGAGL